MCLLFCTVEGACDVQAVSTCTSKLDATGATDKTKICGYYKAAMACYPTSCCSDATWKPVLDASIQTTKTTFKSMNVTCDLKCGSSSSTRASILGAVFMAMAAMAMFSSH